MNIVTLVTIMEDDLPPRGGSTENETSPSEEEKKASLLRSSKGEKGSGIGATIMSAGLVMISLGLRVVSFGVIVWAGLMFARHTLGRVAGPGAADQIRKVMTARIRPEGGEPSLA